MKKMNGNLITLAEQGYFDVIAHGCNCFCRMGSGIALEIKNKYPSVYEADLMTIKGSKLKLGSILPVDIGNFIIVNAYTQYTYGREKIIYADYEAIRKCMKNIKEKFSGKVIGLPLIGAGLAGGDWKIIEKIIDEELGDEDVTIVHFKNK